MADCKSNQCCKEPSVKNFCKIKSRIQNIYLNNNELDSAIKKLLPSNYLFEIPKTLWFIKEKKAKKVALQFPEGLIRYSGSICDIIEKFSDCEVIILSDIVYGACCIDDFTANRLGADVLIHYGHSCLVPIQETTFCSVLYVFVEIIINTNHFVESIKNNFTCNDKLSFVSTIQFIGSLQSSVNRLKECGFKASIEQSRPLSKGEILGCTSPLLSDDTTAYLGDGRFHIESALLQNPNIPAYRYDPYTKILTKESLDYKKILTYRKGAIDTSLKNGTFGIFLGTLGRQGSPKVMEVHIQLIKYLSRKLDTFKKNSHVKIYVSEITNDLIEKFGNSIDTFVQIACPRLSIDWGSSFTKPMLTTYEMSVLLGDAKWNSDKYPMDYYAWDSQGSWTPNHRPPK